MESFSFKLNRSSSKTEKGGRMTNRKQFITTFFCFIFILIFTTLSKANSGDKINSIDITVQILKNGDAKITEEWQVYNG